MYAPFKKLMNFCKSAGERILKMKKFLFVAIDNLLLADRWCCSCVFFCFLLTVWRLVCGKVGRHWL